MLALLSRYWWVLVIRGVMAIALGVFERTRSEALLLRIRDVVHAASTTSCGRDWWPAVCD